MSEVCSPVTGFVLWALACANSVVAAASLQSSCGLYASAAACLTEAVDAARMLTASSSASSSSTASLRSLHPQVVISLLMAMSTLAVVTGLSSVRVYSISTAQSCAIHSDVIYSVNFSAGSIKPHFCTISSSLASSPPLSFFQAIAPLPLTFSNPPVLFPPKQFLLLPPLLLLPLLLFFILCEQVLLLLLLPLCPRPWD